MRRESGPMAEGGDEIVCECELVTRRQVETALKASKSLVLGDLRRDLRVGMGPCQSAFCAYRAAGILTEMRESPVIEANSALLEFLQERWKGLRPVMWGANLRQLELDLLIYRDLLGADRLPTARDVKHYPDEMSG